MLSIQKIKFGERSFELTVVYSQITIGSRNLVFENGTDNSHIVTSGSISFGRVGQAVVTQSIADLGTSLSFGDEITDEVDDLLRFHGVPDSITSDDEELVFGGEIFDFDIRESTENDIFEWYITSGNIMLHT